VGFGGVGGGSDELAIELFEFLRAVGELDDLSRADECEVFGIPEENDILAFVV